MDRSDDIFSQLRTELVSGWPVADLQWYRFTDSVGDPAFRVTVVLKDDATVNERDLGKLKLIQDLIYNALLDRGIQDFPYIRFVTTSELAAEKAA